MKSIRASGVGQETRNSGIVLLGLRYLFPFNNYVCYRLFILLLFSVITVIMFVY